MVSQLALACTLLVGAGLLSRSFLHLSAVEPGLCNPPLFEERFLANIFLTRLPHLGARFLKISIR